MMIGTSTALIVTPDRAGLVMDSQGRAEFDEFRAGQFRFITNNELFEMNVFAERYESQWLLNFVQELVHQQTKAVEYQFLLRQRQGKAFAQGAGVGLGVGVLVTALLLSVSLFDIEVADDERQKVAAVEEAGRTAAEATAAAERNRLIHVGRGAYIVNDSGVHERSAGPAGAVEDWSAGVRRERNADREHTPARRADEPAAAGR